MDPATRFALPPSRANQKYVTVSAIDGGSITLPDKCFVAPSNPYDKRTVPSLAFLVEHPGPNIFGSYGSSKTPPRILFDLGLRSELDRYLAPQQAHLDNRIPYRLGPGVATRLEDGELDPGDIDAVILSHVHYDHHGDPEDFEQSIFIVGPGSLDVLRRGVPGTKGTHQCFDPNLLPKDRTIEFPKTGRSSIKTELPSGETVHWFWKKVGPFPAGIDLFADGSLYVIESPGHLPGHINLLCRTGPGKWIYLAGDSCHDIRLLTGEKEIGTWEDDHGDMLCIHMDRDAAEESIKRIQTLLSLSSENGQEVEVILAHDDVWYRRNKHRMFPEKLSQ